MDNDWKVSLHINQEGYIYFFYKPKKDAIKVKGLQEVQRFYLILQPSQSEIPTIYIVVGKKRLPKKSDDGEVFWAFIEKVGGRGFQVENQDTQTDKRAARPIAEGRYALLHSIESLRLVYQVEYPTTLGTVQKSFGITKEAAFVLLAKHQWPNDGSEQKRGNFVAATPRDLKTEGTELLFIRGERSIAELGIKSPEQHTDIPAIFNRLTLSPKRHPTEPMFGDLWK